jgi:hypothetical protein
MKRFVAGLLKTAIYTVYPFEAESLKAYCQNPDTSVIDQTLLALGSQVKNHMIVNFAKQTTGGGQTFATSSLCE